jgi:hypothetical protein
VASPTAVLTLCQGLAVLNVVVIGSAPGAAESVVVGVVSPGVIEEVMGVGDLVVSHLHEGQHAVNDMRGNVVISVSLGQGLSAVKVLRGDIGQIFS